VSRRWGREALKTVQILGERVEVSVNTDGEFSAKIGLDYCRADTLKALMGQLRKAAGKTRITLALPATIIGYNKYSGHGVYRKFLGVSVARGVITGINPKTNEIQFTHDDGEKESGRWAGDRRSFGKPMTDEQIAEYERLYVAHSRAEKQLEAFVERHRYKDPFDTVRKAIAQAADEVKEEPEVEEDPRLAAPRRRRA
jgi:hypothetical protein